MIRGKKKKSKELSKKLLMLSKELKTEDGLRNKRRRDKRRKDKNEKLMYEQWYLYIIFNQSQITYIITSLKQFNVSNSFFTLIFIYIFSAIIIISIVMSLIKLL